MAAKTLDAGSTLRTVTGIAMRDAAGVLRIATLGRIRDAGNVLRTFFSSLSVSLSHFVAYGYANSADPIDITTQTVTATPTGGLGPYTYSWARTDADPGTWTINSPTSAATRFTCQGVNVAENFSGTFVCTVTDANGGEADSESINAICTNISSGGGVGPLP